MGRKCFYDEFIKKPPVLAGLISMASDRYSEPNEFADKPKHDEIFWYIGHLNLFYLLKTLKI